MRNIVGENFIETRIHEEEGTDRQRKEQTLYWRLYNGDTDLGNLDDNLIETRIHEAEGTDRQRKEETLYWRLYL